MVLRRISSLVCSRRESNPLVVALRLLERIVTPFRSSWNASPGRNNPGRCRFTSYYVTTTSSKQISLTTPFAAGVPQQMRSSPVSSSPRSLSITAESGESNKKAALQTNNNDTASRCCATNQHYDGFHFHDENSGAHSSGISVA